MVRCSFFINQDLGSVAPKVSFISKLASTFNVLLLALTVNDLKPSIFQKSILHHQFSRLRFNQLYRWALHYQRQRYVNLRPSIFPLRDGTCPIIGDHSATYYPDKSADREIQELKVYCVNKDSGCTWRDKLKLLEVDFF